MHTDVLDALIAERFDGKGPGAVVGVVKDGEVVYEHARGLASIEWEQPLAPAIVLALGSLTKPFTAQAIMLLELDGKLRVANAAVSYLPELDWLDPRITIAHLLTHTSGIANYVTQPSFWENMAQRDHTPDELAAHIGSLLPDFAPGERYSYSNSGYALLGMIVERASGVPYDEYVRAAICTPLGMQDSRSLRDDVIVPRRAAGYQPANPDEGGRPYRRAPFWSATLAVANGGLGSTLRDMIRWDAALRKHRLLPADVEARMLTPVTLNDGRTMGQGLGWGLSHYHGRTAAHHAGGVPGFSSFFARFLDDDLTIFVLSNLGGFDAAGLAAAIANHMLSLPTPQRLPAPVGAEELAAAEGTYTNPIGERLEVVRAGERLAISGDLAGEFVPVGDAEYASADNPDVTVRFEALVDGPYTRATAIVPFYWFEVNR